MNIFHTLDEVHAAYGATIVSAGNFDGVHRAHQLVLGKMVERARELGAKSVAVTFEPHPIRILRPDVAPKLLTPLPAKLKRMEASGLDAVLVLPFTRDLSLLSPRQFAEEILSRGLRAREVHEGTSFHFGHRAEGNVERLQEFGRACGFEVHVYPELRVRGDVVSSSRIRELVAAGQVGRVRHLLGRLFSITATAGRGRGYGQKYTVPTINLSRYDEATPGDGVYISSTRIGNECFDSVTNIGSRPTFGADSFAIESHLLNFHPLEVTAETEVEIFFRHRLRPEIKFPSVDALREQIARDVHRARQYFRLAPARPADAAP